MILIGVSTGISYQNFRQLMDNVTIVQYFKSNADNLNWHTVYIRAVLPEEEYRGNRTMNAIRLYVIMKNKNIPNHIDIVLYHNMEKFMDCESYAEAAFKK